MYVVCMVAPTRSETADACLMRLVGTRTVNYTHISPLVHCFENLIRWIRVMHLAPVASPPPPGNGAKILTGLHYNTCGLHKVGRFPTIFARMTVIVRHVENDRNPNFSYLPNRNILLNPNYSAKCRIPEYYALTANRQLFGFGRIFCKIFCRIFRPK